MTPAPPTRLRRAAAAALLSLLPPRRRRQRAPLRRPGRGAAAARVAGHRADQQPIVPAARADSSRPTSTGTASRSTGCSGPTGISRSRCSRLLNSAWMIAAWFLRTLGLRRFDAIVVGSDPAFSPALALGLRLAYPRAAIVHWCFDLYPEAIEAEGEQRRRARAGAGGAAADGAVVSRVRRPGRSRATHAGAPGRVRLARRAGDAGALGAGRGRARRRRRPGGARRAVRRRQAGLALLGEPRPRPRVRAVPAAGARLPRALGRRDLVLLRRPRLPRAGAAARRPAGRHQRPVRAVRRRERAAWRASRPPTCTC